MQSDGAEGDRQIGKGRGAVADKGQKPRTGEMKWEMRREIRKGKRMGKKEVGENERERPRKGEREVVEGGVWIEGGNGWCEEGEQKKKEKIKKEESKKMNQEKEI